MITRPWSEKSKQLVGPWTLFGKDSRVVKLFHPIISSAEIAAIGGSIAGVAEDVFGDLILLSQESSDPVKIVINSPGGSIQAGFTIIQAVEHLKAKGIEVWTVGLCHAASMAGVILAMGTQGRRYILDNAMAHAHEVQVGGPRGGITNAEESQEYAKHLRSVIEKIFAQGTKIPEYYKKLMDEELDPKKLNDLNYRMKQVREFVKQERLLTADMALEAGMVDHIIIPGDPILDEIFSRVKRGENQS